MMVKILCIFLLICLVIFIFKSLRRKSKLNLADEFLVLNYHKKPTLYKKVVLIVETCDNLSALITLIRSILNQNIKVDSLILISENFNLKKVPLIHNTCIFNKIGGMTFLMKESSCNTILVFIFSEGFKAFIQPNFLQEYLENQIEIDGLVKVETDKVKVDINKIYGSTQL